MQINDSDLENLKTFIRDEIRLIVRETVKEEVAGIKDEIDEMKQNQQKWDERFDTYQKANQIVINLAFGLIASAAVITVASAIFRR